MATHLTLGKKGEELAALYLEEKGFKILEKNWRHNKAEVDLIASHENKLVIVEVKTRSTDFFGPPEEAVSNAKQRLLSEAAHAYIENRKLDLEVRYDIISIIDNKEHTQLHHIADAFYPYMK